MFRSWALVERVGRPRASDAAPDSAAKAVELALLARRIAEVCPGEEVAGGCGCADMPSTT